MCLHPLLSAFITPLPRLLVHQATRACSQGFIRFAVSSLAVTYFDASYSRVGFVMVNFLGHLLCSCIVSLHLLIILNLWRQVVAA